jgi:aspartyl-tRNA(Asn)/glutamyl-tRNA(Gln) amidotransferase subunit A
MDVKTQHTDLCALGVAELAGMYRRGEVSPVDVVRATLDRIDRLNPTLNAYITVLRESAEAAALAAEAQLRAGVDLGPMHGVPVSVKDIIRIKGTQTTAASLVLDDQPADAEDATVVQRLRAAGAIIIGKANLHEFAFGDPDPQNRFGLVQNPRKFGYQCGGSSSGSGCAIAAGLSVISIGSDTGGSIRHPASVCGVVGLKPSWGLVPVRGVIPLSADLDHIGPIGRSVADVAAALTTVAGWDREDPYSVREFGDNYLFDLDSGVRGLRLGLPTNAIFQFGFAEAIALLDNARAALVAGGMTPVDISLKRVEEVTDIVRNTLIPVELWHYHRQFREREPLYGRHFLERALPGLAITAPDYLAAKQIQAEVRREWRDLFQRVEIIMIPSTVGGTTAHGAGTIEVNGKNYPLRTVTSPFNPLSNITGFPAIALPVGRTKEGMPVAAQLIGPPHGERKLLAVAHYLEQALGGLTDGWGIEPC